ncbi:ATP-dependent RNA helicase ROK1 [Cryptococcus depauperatus CBS 7841]|uniref:RNA helicase n=1 Tax=Cryptococcus depauperatus CBS 7841 TaxID=1295531 RepID=A0A1E3HYI2_9TREE|nr:ATP-dependent RNA helicase ROK1 [Cryptococcus depauperatus CBS 7841]
MASAFSLLTAGGARFDKNRFGGDIELFSGHKSRKEKRKSKERGSVLDAGITLPSALDFFGDHAHHAPRLPQEELEDGSDIESESSSAASVPAPPPQKITLTGADPLPKSLHTNLPSLVNHENYLLTSAQGRPLLSALSSANIHSLWGVQCAVGGCLLENRDVVCIAPTGSGKTLSYILPTIVKLVDPARSLKGREEGKGIRALVLVPTHDLAIQIEGVVKAITKGRHWRCMVLTKATEKAVWESSPGSATAACKEDSGDEDEQVDDDEFTSSVDEFIPKVSGNPEELGIDLLIATPERLHHLVDSKRISLAQTKHIILDESDRLLSPDFLPQIEPILTACTNPSIQKCFLSATMPSSAEALSKKWLREGGVRVVVGIKDSAVTTVDQSLLYTSTEAGKILALRNLITSGHLPYPSLIFVQSIERAEQLCKTLVLDGIRVESVHGGKAKTKRDEAVNDFRLGKVWMLVVTEVLARGMDFRGVKVVINYDFPQTVQSYIHRIGRTGRAGRPGKAITFFNTEDSLYLRTIANILRSSGCPVPEYMLELKKPTKNEKRKLAKAPPKRKAVGGGGRDLNREAGKKRRDMIEASKKRMMRNKKEKTVDNTEVDVEK